MLFLDKKVLKSVCFPSSILGFTLSDSHKKNKKNKNTNPATKKKSCLKEILSCRVLMDDTHTHISSHTHTYTEANNVLISLASPWRHLCVGLEFSVLKPLWLGL